MFLADKELNELVLRPRFDFKIEHSNEVALAAFEAIKKTQEEFNISRVDDHIFIKYPKEKRNAMSPELHLEINAIDEGTSHVRGLFGPNPTTWTLFMFIHFVLAVLFIGFGIAVYTKWSLGKPFELHLALLVLPLIGWVILYFIGKYRKEQSIPQMLAQHHFMRDVLRGLK